MEFIINKTKAAQEQNLQMQATMKAVKANQEPMAGGQSKLQFHIPLPIFISGGVDKIQEVVDQLFDKIVPRHIASKEIDLVGKLKTIEIETEKLIEMRANVMKYGDLNLYSRRKGA